MGDRGKAKTLKLKTLKSEIGGRGRGHIFWFRLLHRGLLSAVLCAALGKPGRGLAVVSRSFTRVTAFAHERPLKIKVDPAFARGYGSARDHARERSPPGNILLVLGAT